MIKTFMEEPYRWLSNMSPFEQPFYYDGLFYRTNEHFYVAMKTTDKGIRKQISEIKSPGQVKKLGRDLELTRTDWNLLKVPIMEIGLRYKFSEHNPILREKLIDTGDCYIQEGNTWGDTFWGVDLTEEVGSNRLGKLLMKIRGEIINV